MEILIIVVIVSIKIILKDLIWVLGLFFFFVNMINRIVDVVVKIVIVWLDGKLVNVVSFLLMIWNCWLFRMVVGLGIVKKFFFKWLSEKVNGIVLNMVVYIFVFIMLINEISGIRIRVLFK